MLYLQAAKKVVDNDVAHDESTESSGLRRYVLALLKLLRNRTGLDTFRCFPLSYINPPILVLLLLFLLE